MIPHMKAKDKFWLIISILILFAGMAVNVSSIGTGSSSSWPKEEKKAAPETAASLYDKGVAADKSGNDKAALDYFKKALNMDRNNPDILNMLAHSERKLGMINEAIEDYWKALKLRPKFPQAREYMGEAYIQAVLKEIETLKTYGKEGEEERNDLIKSFKDAAANLQP